MKKSVSCTLETTKEERCLRHARVATTVTANPGFLNSTNSRRIAPDSLEGYVILVILRRKVGLIKCLRSSMGHRRENYHVLVRQRRMNMRNFLSDIWERACGSKDTQTVPEVICFSGRSCDIFKDELNCV